MGPNNSRARLVKGIAGITDRQWHRIVHIADSIDERPGAHRADPHLLAELLGGDRALDLADRFDDDPQFSGALLSALIGRTRDEGQKRATPTDTRPEMASDLRARAFAALGSHAERHGGASPIKIIQAPGGPEELLAKMTEIVRQDHAPILDLIEMIRQGRAPMGMLSTMLGHPYSSILAQRPLGYLIAAASNDTDEAADENAAAAARDGDVVTDISALLVSSVLSEFDYARGQFRTLLSPTASRHDITAGRSRMDGWSASSGSVSYDPVRGTAVPRDLDIDGHLAALDRFAKLERALSRTQLTSVPPASTLGEPVIEDAEHGWRLLPSQKSAGCACGAMMSPSGTLPGPAASPPSEPSRSSSCAPPSTSAPRMPTTHPAPRSWPPGAPR